VLSVLATACGNNGPGVHDAEALVCPELGGNADLLELPYADDPIANARIRAFMATTRGLADVVLEMEQTVVSTCGRMSRDLGLPAATSEPNVTQACEPIRAQLARLAASGIELRVSFVTPSCGNDTRREARCSSICSVAGPECAALCTTQAALYAECTLPAVAVAASSELPEVLRLARTLEENLPALLYVELALGRRLAEQTQSLVGTATKIPSDVANAGPRGVACVTLAAAMVGKAVSRLSSAVSIVETTTALLDPEVHPSSRVAR
jgi:hypothetical protein